MFFSFLLWPHLFFGIWDFFKHVGTDKIGSLKIRTNELMIDPVLWRDFDNEVGEMVSGKMDRHRLKSPHHRLMLNV